MKKLALAALLSLLCVPAAQAGDLAHPVEVSPFAGAFLPVAGQRAALSSALLLGARASWDLHENVAVVGTVAWARPEAGGADVDLFQWDIGLQGQAPVALARGWSLEPYAGVGVGTRTYSFVKLDLQTRTDFVFYSGLGVDLRRDHLAVGVTARHQLSAFSPVGASDARGDVVLLGSLSWRF